MLKKTALQLVLQHLAARTPREPTVQQKLARAHVLRDAGLAHQLRQLGPKLLGQRRGGRVRPRNHCGHDTLAIGLVGQAEDGRLGEEGVRKQRMLDSGGGYIFPPGLDEVAARQNGDNPEEINPERNYDLSRVN